MRALASALTLSSVLVLSFASLSPASQNESGEEAIRAVVKSYMDARNNHDEHALRSLFTEDADQLVSSGEWRRGLPALVSGAMASSSKEANRSTISVDAIRLLDADVAIVDGLYRTFAASNGAERKMRTTLIVKRDGTAWKIAAIRNMLPAPASAK